MEQLKKFKEFTDEIMQNNSRLFKTKVLEKYKNDPDIRFLLEFTFNAYKITGLSTKKMTMNIQLPEETLFSSFHDLIEYILLNNTGTNETVGHVRKFISSLNDTSLSTLATQLIMKDLQIGIQAPSINKVFGKDFIPTFDVMLAEDYKDFIKYVNGKQFIITEKLDGIRAVLMWDKNGNPQFFTRNGRIIEELVELESEAREYLNFQNLIFDGELLKDQPGLPAKDLYRATLKIVSSNGEKRQLIFNIFDAIDKKDFKDGYSERTCSERKDFICKTIPQTALHIKYVKPLYIGDDISQIEILLENALSLEKEGIMVNLSDAPWQNARVKDLLKLKGEKTADVRVIKLEEGVGRNIGKLGSVIVEFIGPDKNIHTCSVGSGFKDKERKLFWDNPSLLENKIIEILYTDISSNEKNKNYSLRFPRFKCLRADKDEISMS